MLRVREGAGGQRGREEKTEGDERSMITFGRQKGASKRAEGREI